MVCHINARRNGSSGSFSLVIVCDGVPRPIRTSSTINVSGTTGSLTYAPAILPAINAAIDQAQRTSRANGPAIRDINVRAEFGSIRTSIEASISATPISTGTPRPAPPRVAEPTTPVATVRPRRATPGPEPTPRVTRATVPTRTPREVSSSWISDQLAGISRERTDRLGAVSALYNAREQMIPFLNNPANSNQVILATFNALYQIPLFRSYLNMQAATPELTQRFEDLQAVLEPNGLPQTADATTLRSALAYIRYFAYYFAPTSVVLGGPAFRGEIAVDTSPVDANAAGGLHRASRFYYLSQRAQGQTVPDGWGTRFIYNPPNLNNVLDPQDANGLMDADTVVVAGLMMRRWYAVHPPTGTGVEIGAVRQWQAPAVAGQEATPTPQQPVAQVNRIGIIGDSITEGNYGRNLQTIAGSAVSVDSFGVSGQGSGPISRRFQRDILDHNPAFTTVVIQAGVNDLPSSSSIDTIRNNISGMITAARARGMQVVVVPILPWAGYGTSSDRAQTLTTELNAWLRTQNDGNNVIVVDPSPLSDPTNPTRMRANFTRDGLHPNREGNAALAQLIYDQAISPTHVTPAQQYANANWSNLSGRIANDMRSSSPQGLVDLIRTVSALHPTGTTSLDAALTNANRTDLRDSFITFFNEVLNNQNTQLGREFARFVTVNSGTYPSSMLGPSVRLTTATDQNQVSLCVRAAQNFLNAPSRNGQLGTDLGYAFGASGLNISPTDRVNPSGVVDLATLTALGVYNYRLAHLSERMPAWAVTLGYQPIQQQQTQPDAGAGRVRLTL